MSFPWSPEYELLPDYGTLFTLEDFTQMCLHGSLIDYDGTGYYATDKQMTNKDANPSDFAAGAIDHKWTHVIWFNK